MDSGVVCQGEENALRPGGRCRVTHVGGIAKAELWLTENSGATTIRTRRTATLNPARRSRFHPRPAHNDPSLSEYGRALLWMRCSSGRITASRSDSPRPNCGVSVEGERSKE